MKNGKGNKGGREKKGGLHHIRKKKGFVVGRKSQRHKLLRTGGRVG